MDGREVYDGTLICSQSGGPATAVAYALKFGVRFPDSVFPDPTLTFSDAQGGPAIWNGVPLTAAVTCPGICEICSGSCEVDSIHPPPPNQKWVEFSTIDSLYSSTSDGSVEANFTLEFSPGSCSSFSGQQIAIWASDNTDDLYGRTVTDAYQDNIMMSVPTFSGAGVVLLFVTLAGLGCVALFRQT